MALPNEWWKKWTTLPGLLAAWTDLMRLMHSDEYFSVGYNKVRSRVGGERRKGTLTKAKC
jgi:hypothetical protein